MDDSDGDDVNDDDMKEDEEKFPDVQVYSSFIFHTQIMFG